MLALIRSQDEWIDIFKRVRFGHEMEAKETYETSHIEVKGFIEAGIIQKHDRVLDIGSENGRMAIALTQYELQEYVGIESIKESIDFCQETFKAWDTFRFIWINVQSDCYNPDGTVKPIDFRVPSEDGYFDSVITASLFTRLGTKEICHHYLAEIDRVLKPGGKLFSSWFRCPPNELLSGEQRTVLLETDIIEIVSKYFEIYKTRGGNTTAFHDQWCLYSRKKETASIIDLAQNQLQHYQNQNQSRTKLDELQNHWNEFGRRDPLWAILTDPSKTNRRWEQQDFFETGRVQIAQVLQEIEAIHSFPHRKALDFGCGVGRLTQALCQYFAQCCGVDIAPSMIECAKQYNKFGTKCQYYLNEFDDLRIFESNSFDFVYSFITLQHIRPGHSKNYIKEFLRILVPGGVAVFQVPSHLLAPSPHSDVAPEPFLDSAYRAQITAQSLWVVSAAETAVLSVRVKHLGDTAWSVLEAPPVRLGNHWLDSNQQLMILDDGRVDLLNHLQPGEEIEVSITIHTPSIPGKYFLELDLVHERVTWFKDKGSVTTIVQVDVQPSQLTSGVTPASLPTVNLEEPEPQPSQPIFIPVMEMHGVPKEEVLELIRDCGGVVLRVRDDLGAGDAWQGYCYFVTKGLQQPVGHRQSSLGDATEHSRLQQIQANLERSRAWLSQIQLTHQHWLQQGQPPQAPALSAPSLTISSHEQLEQTAEPQIDYLDVAFFCCRLLKGFGVDMVVATQAKYLAAWGHRVRIYTPKNDEFHTESFARIGNIEVIQLSEAVLASHIQEIDCDVAIAHTDPFFELILTMKPNVTKIAWDHGEPTPELFPPELFPEGHHQHLRNIKEARRSRHTLNHKTVAISDFIRHDMGFTQAEIIFNGSDHLLSAYPHYLQFKGRTVQLITDRGYTPPESPFLLCVARLDPHSRLYKGNDSLAYLSQLVQMPIVLVGKSASPDDVEHHRRQGLICLENLTSEDLIGAYLDCAAVVSLSQWEGCNLPLLEAMSLGKPAFALDCGAHRETGAYVAPTIELLANLIQTRIDDPFTPPATLISWKTHAQMLNKMMIETRGNHLINFLDSYKEDNSVLSNVRQLQHTTQTRLILSRQTPELSILILTKDRLELLKPCLESLQMTGADVNYEVLIGDTGSTSPLTPDYYCSIPHPVHFIGFYNFSAGNNYLAQKARGKYILLLNNDTEAIMPALAKVLQIFKDAGDRIGVIGSRLLYPDFRVQHAGVRLNQDAFYVAEHVHHCRKHTDPEVNQSKIVPAVTGACLFTVRDLYLESGGLDPQYQQECQEIDYCLKLKQRYGLKTYYSAESVWIHKEGKTRTVKECPEDRQLFHSRWCDLIAHPDMQYT